MIDVRILAESFDAVGTRHEVTTPMTLPHETVTIQKGLIFLPPYSHGRTQFHGYRLRKKRHTHGHPQKKHKFVGSLRRKDDATNPRTSVASLAVGLPHLNVSPGLLYEIQITKNKFNPDTFRRRAMPATRILSWRRRGRKPIMV